MKDWRSILMNFLSRFGSAVINLGLSVLISQWQGAETKGDHALFIAGVAMIHLITNWIGASSLVYLAPRYHNGQLLKIAGIWALLSGTIAGGILFLLNLIPAEQAAWLIAASIVFAWWNNLAHVFLGRQALRQYNLLQLTSPLFTLLLYLLSFQFYPTGLNAFAFSYCGAQSLTLLIGIFLFQQQEESLPPGKLRELGQIIWRHSRFIQLANISQFLNYRLPYYLVDAYFGRQFLGIYSNAQSITESVWMFTRSISTVQLARISNTDDDAEHRRITREYGFLSAIISGVALCLILLLPAEVYQWIFGREFGEMKELLFFLAPAILAMSLSNIYAHYFAGKARNQVNFYASFLVLASLTCLFFLFLGPFGKFSAPLAYSFSFLFGLILQWFFYKTSKNQTLKYN